MSKELTIFYDGGCPLCVTEMRHLYERNVQNKIAFEDIYGASASEELLDEINSRFQKVDDYAEDLEELEAWMLDRHLQPRIFRISVPLRGAKFSTEHDV